MLINNTRILRVLRNWKGVEIFSEMVETEIFKTAFPCRMMVKRWYLMMDEVQKD